MPVQCVHILLAGRSVLVDVCHPELLADVGESVIDRLHPACSTSSPRAALRLLTL
jgi:hypothetical protein